MEQLDLRRPIYQKTAAYGHFGRTDPDFTWENTDIGREAGGRFAAKRLTRVAVAAPPRRAGLIPLVVAARGLDRVLDYAVPDELDGAARARRARRLPARARGACWAWWWARAAPTHEGRLAPLAGVVDDAPRARRTCSSSPAGWRATTSPRAAACLRLVLPPGGGRRPAPRRRTGRGRSRRRPRGRRAPGGPAARPAPSRRSGSPRRREVAEALAARGRARCAAAELCAARAPPWRPCGAMAEAGVIALDGEPVGPSALDGRGGPRAAVPTRRRALTADQEAALAAIEAAMDGGGGALLLHGVTGSGKTEVYLRAIEAARARGRGSIVLVPEIALTPQLLGRLRARLGERHRGVALGPDARPSARPSTGACARATPTWSWARAAPSSRRSPRLGLVVVDEEHDSSYKQDSARPATTPARSPPAGRAPPAPPWSTAAPRRAPRPGTRCRG